MYDIQGYVVIVSFIGEANLKITFDPVIELLDVQPVPFY
jgi:hypothetical protein